MQIRHTLDINLASVMINVGIIRIKFSCRSKVSKTELGVLAWVLQTNINIFLFPWICKLKMLVLGACQMKIQIFNMHLQKYLTLHCWMNRLALLINAFTLNLTAASSFSAVEGQSMCAFYFCIWGRGPTDIMYFMRFLQLNQAPIKLVRSSIARSCCLVRM